MTLNRDDEQRITQIVSDIVEETVVNRLGDLLPTMPEQQRELVGQHLARFMQGLQPAFRRPENTYTPRILLEGGDVNHSTYAATAGTEVGFANPTLPRIINFAEGFQAKLNARDEGQQIDIKAVGSAGLLCYDYLVSDCWATAAAERGLSDPAEIELFTGCTTKIASTVKKAIDDIISLNGNTNYSVAICPGDYTDVITWPGANDGANVTGVTLVGLAAMNTGDGHAGCANIGPTGAGTSNAINHNGNPADMHLENVVLKGQDSGWSIYNGGSAAPIDGGVNLHGIWHNCYFDKPVDFSSSHLFVDTCIFNEGIDLTGDTSSIDQANFVNCSFGASVDTSAISDAVNELRFAACHFASGARVISIGVNSMAITDCTFNGAADNTIHVSVPNSENRNAILIQGNQFNGKPTSGNQMILFDVSSGAGDFTECQILGNTFNGGAMSSLSSSTAWIKFDGSGGAGGDTLLRSIIAFNNFGGNTGGPTGAIEDAGGFSVIADGVDRCVIGFNTPVAKCLYNITNGTNVKIDAVILSSGAPSHTDNEGTFYKDTSTDTLYINTSTGTGSTWSIVGVSGGGGAAPTPHDFVGTHHDHDTDYTQTPNVDGIGVGGGDIDVYSDNGVTQTGEWDSTTGHIAIGTTVLTTTPLLISRTITDANSQLVFATLTVGNTGGGQTIRGLRFLVDGPTAGNDTVIRGIDGTVRHNSSGTLDDLIAVRSNLISSVSGSGAITAATEFWGIASWGSDVPATIYGFRLDDIGGTGATVYPIYIPSTTGTAIHSVHVPAMRIGSVTAPTNKTAGDLTATRLIVPDAAIVHSAVSQLGGPVVIPAAGALRFSDSDNSHYTAFKAHDTTTETGTYVLPPADGSADQVLTTDGSFNLSWQDAGAGGGGASEMFISAERFRPTLTSGCAAPHLIDSGTEDVLVFVCDFDATSDEFAVCKFGLPSTYGGGTIDVTFYWMTSSSTNTHTCRWGVKGGFYDDATTLNTALGTEVFVDDNATSTANQVLVSDPVTVTLAGAAASAGMVVLRISRDPDHANDDLNVDARLLGVHVSW